jgi:hypothetical protein
MLLLSWILAAGLAAAPRDVLVWLSAGHELGTHGCAHLDYAATDLPVYLADLERGRRSLAPFPLAGGESASGTTLLVFRRLPEGWRIVQDASM